MHSHHPVLNCRLRCHMLQDYRPSCCLTLIQCLLINMQEAWSVMSRQPYTALSVKHDSQLVAVGNAAGCVAIHDVRNFRVPSSLQQFSNTSAPVSVVRWQHLHVSRGSRAPSSTVSAATSTVSATGQSSNPLAAAWRQQQQQQQQQHSASQSQRPSISVPAAVALVNAQSAGVGSVHLQPPAPGTVKGNVTGTLEPDTPSTSISASMVSRAVNLQAEPTEPAVCLHCHRHARLHSAVKNSDADMQQIVHSLVSASFIHPPFTYSVSAVLMLLSCICVLHHCITRSLACEHSHQFRWEVMSRHQTTQQHQLSAGKCNCRQLL